MLAMMMTWQLLCAGLVASLLFPASDAQSHGGSVQPDIGSSTIDPYGGFGDKLSNCNQYDRAMCHSDSIYYPWAVENCPCTCQLCDPFFTTTPAPCEDQMPNCAEYGPEACVTEIYRPWANDNCRKTCNLCACVDKADNCEQYGRYACSGRYEAWARENCAKTCGHCHHSPVQFRGTTLPPNPSCTVPAGHTLLMKAVAGAPGDVYQLWSSPNTALHDVTAAMSLSPSVMSHYKAPLANTMHTCSFDTIKVSIYKDCIEKAYLTFSGQQSTGRDDWFAASHLLTSSFGDLSPFSGANFRISGDPNTGREFYVGEGGGVGCSGSAWFFVGTRTTCAWEREGDKPAFYFAPGHTAQQLQTGFLESGDVLAIIGQGGSCSQGKSTAASHTASTPDRCVYKNHVYQEDQWWTDGCLYNCTCHNGAYQCFDLCQTYSNLPANCPLVKRPWECCPTPHCINGTMSGCVYKGNMYQEGHTWTDGCNYRCTCIDGTTGHYQCTARCPQMQLPPECHMTSAPAGKCCPVPLCPDNIHVQFPPGYVQE